MNKQRNSINWVGLIYLLFLITLMGFIFINLSGEMVCRINHFSDGCSYGKFWVACAVLGIFYLLSCNINLSKEKK